MRCYIIMRFKFYKSGCLRTYVAERTMYNYNKRRAVIIINTTRFYIPIRYSQITIS